MRRTRSEAIEIGKMIASRKNTPVSHKLVVGVIALGWWLSPIDDVFQLAAGPGMLIDELFLTVWTIATYTQRYAAWYYARRARKGRRLPRV